MAKAQATRQDTRPVSRIQRGLEERAGWWSWVLELPLAWAVVAIGFCSWMLLPRVEVNLPQWEPGEVASFEVAVPKDMTLPDEAATEAARQAARDAVLPVYDLEPRLQLEFAEGLQALFAECRAWRDLGEDRIETSFPTQGFVVSEAMQSVLRASECSAELEGALLEITSQLHRMRIVDDRPSLVKRGANGVVLRNLATGTEQTVSLEDLQEVLDSRSDVEPALRARLLEQDVVLRRWIRPIVEFCEANLLPNMGFNRAETAERVRTAQDQVTPRSQVFRRGQVLLRRGDTVTPAVAETLRALSAQRQGLTGVATIAGTVLLVAAMTLGWWRILRRIPGISEGGSGLSTILILMMVFVAVDRIAYLVATAFAELYLGASSFTVDSYLWGIPYAAGPIVVLMLLGMEAALLFSLYQALVAGVMLGGEFSAMVYALAACLVGTLAVRQLKDRAVLTRVGVVVGAANVAMVLILALYSGFNEGPRSLLLSMVAAFFAGPLATGVAGFVLPVLESLFGITTSIRLLELSNQNLPLLKRLSLAAPGTYQHSLAVGNLAEAGADAVGADGLKLRVCAYYHDVGKLSKPEYYVENQRGDNPHDTLLPSMSALVIQSHVKEGLAIARKEKLPLPIRQAIATHHGTKVIKYFYDKACKNQDPELGEVQESDYRYPGPRPDSKEMGILLLADAVEAAARTLENPSPNKLQNMISKIFQDVLEDGQLDSSDLTFIEVDKVASAFLWVLTNMYHHRIDYPGFEFNRRHGKRESGSYNVGTKTVPADG